ncbi:MAG: hypothetical protein IT232_03250 [Flavobacteriales bacterium]|nr:hypothetical protein [Flavobacteriales bacterium]
MKHRGSEIFGTSVMNTEEVILCTKVMIKNKTPKNELMEHISFIDDCLSMLKMESIINAQRKTPTGRIRKNSRLSDMIDGRLNVLIQNLKQQ